MMNMALKTAGVPVQTEPLGDLDTVARDTAIKRMNLAADAHCIRQNIVDTFSCDNRVSLIPISTKNTSCFTLV